MSVKLGEMSFVKDFVGDDRGDLYPIRYKSEGAKESVCSGKYRLDGGKVSRFICRLFPFASYEVTFSSDEGEAGFVFLLKDVEAEIGVSGQIIRYSCSEHSESMDISCVPRGERTLVVSLRPGAFDIYFRISGKAEYIGTIYEEAFSQSNREESFTAGGAFLAVSGRVTVSCVSACVDNGVSIADIRPVKYEDGTAIFEDGKIYITASVRMQENAFQGIFSWVPGTAQFDMTGAVFYDPGDGFWRNYLAPVMIYNRRSGRWLVWVSSFEHKHILAKAEFEGDVRFGVNVVDVEIMPAASEESEITDFVGFRGDEDPDIIYDEKSRRWLMAICRLDQITRAYGYFFFEADDPMGDFRYIGNTSGSETGGSFVKCEGELFFICGNGTNRSEYRIYGEGGMELAKFDRPDGGFRGWGSVMPVRMGSRTRYFWLTFDRHRGSGYNWSYGNLYCFEMSRY